MTGSNASLHHEAREPSNPKLPPLAPGELATRLRLIPPIVPEPDGRKPKPFFAACAATSCKSPAEKFVFMAYAAVAGKTGATWAIKRNRVWFFARQAKVVEITGYTMRTVQRMTFRLLKSGRLRCVQSGRGRLPHAIMVVPDGWNSQSRGVTGSPLRSVEASDNRLNRASSKRRAQYAARLEEETPSPGTVVKPAEGPVTQPALAVKAAPSVPSQDEQKNPDPKRKLVVLARPDQAQPYVEAMREIVQRTATHTQPADQLPEPTPERRAAALAMFAAVDAGIDVAAKREAPIARTGEGIIGGGSMDGYTVGTPDTCPRCGYDRIYHGGCESCGADLRDYGADFNHGH